MRAEKMIPIDAVDISKVALMTMRNESQIIFNRRAIKGKGQSFGSWHRKEDS
jgi:hypothetical protein